jgi:hypothetical protein
MLINPFPVRPLKWPSSILLHNYSGQSIMLMFCWVAVLVNNLVLISTNHWRHSRRHIMEIAYICLSHYLWALQLTKHKSQAKLEEFKTITTWDYMTTWRFIMILWCIDPLHGNAHNTHMANNTGAVFSVVRAWTLAMQCTLGACSQMHGDITQQWSKWGRQMFSGGPCLECC